MARLKDKIIKSLGGFTESEFDEKVEREKMKLWNQEISKNYIIKYPDNKIVRFTNQAVYSIFNKPSEDYIKDDLIEKLLDSIKDCVHIEVGHNRSEDIYTAEIDVLVK